MLNIWNFFSVFFFFDGLKKYFWYQEKINVWIHLWYDLIKLDLVFMKFRKLPNITSQTILMIYWQLYYFGVILHEVRALHLVFGKSKEHKLNHIKIKLNKNIHGVKVFFVFDTIREVFYNRSCWNRIQEVTSDSTGHNWLFWRTQNETSLDCIGKPFKIFLKDKEWRVLILSFSKPPLRERISNIELIYYLYQTRPCFD